MWNTLGTCLAPCDPQRRGWDRAGLCPDRVGFAWESGWALPNTKREKNRLFYMLHARSYSKTPEICTLIVHCSRNMTRSTSLSSLDTPAHTCARLPTHSCHALNLLSGGNILPSSPTQPLCTHPVPRIYNCHPCTLFTIGCVSWKALF